MNLNEKVQQIFNLLQNEYSEIKVMLYYTTPLELLIATILSAQCTDERVNIVTKDLFKKYPKVQDYASADLEELQEDIRSTGFYKNKAKSIKNAALSILNDYDGEVPGTMEKLVKLSGVGRKTANVVLGNCFNTPAIIVDTHFKRLMGRIGLSKNTNPDKIEMDLINITESNNRTNFSNYITTHGRKVCKSRKPLCEQCVISHLCDYYLNEEYK